MLSLWERRRCQAVDSLVTVATKTFSCFNLSFLSRLTRPTIQRPANGTTVKGTPVSWKALSIRSNAHIVCKAGTQGWHDVCLWQGGDYPPDAPHPQMRAIVRRAPVAPGCCHMRWVRRARECPHEEVWRAGELEASEAIHAYPNRNLPP